MFAAIGLGNLQTTGCYVLVIAEVGVPDFVIVRTVEGRMTTDTEHAPLLLVKQQCNRLRNCTVGTPDNKGWYGHSRLLTHLATGDFWGGLAFLVEVTICCKPQLHGNDEVEERLIGHGVPVFPLFDGFTLVGEHHQPV